MYCFLYVLISGSAVITVRAWPLPSVHPPLVRHCLGFKAPEARAPVYREVKRGRRRSGRTHHRLLEPPLVELTSQPRRPEFARHHVHTTKNRCTLQKDRPLQRRRVVGWGGGGGYPYNQRFGGGGSCSAFGQHWAADRHRREGGSSSMNNSGRSHRTAPLRGGLDGWQR